MGTLIFYTVLLVAFCGSLLTSLFYPTTLPQTIAKLSGFLALLTGFANALQKSSLTVYFLFQRIAVKFSPDTTSRWWFSARYDGFFEDAIVQSLTSHLTSKDFRFSTRVEREDVIGAQVEIDQTLRLNIQYEPRHLSQDETDHITVISNVMEVSYGHARNKLERQILPVLQALNDLLRPINSSFELDVQFLDRNPFFAVYISHLRPEQVHDYKVILHLDSAHATGKAETVEVSKEKVHVTAKSTNAFKSVAEQFVLLSPDLKILRAR